MAVLYSFIMLVLLNPDTILEANLENKNKVTKCLKGQAEGEKNSSFDSQIKLLTIEASYQIPSIHLFKLSWYFI